MNLNCECNESEVPFNLFLEETNWTITPLPWVGLCYAMLCILCYTALY